VKWVILLYIVTYKGLAWLIIVGSRFDDWICWTSLLQLHLITTAHTLNSFLITNLSLLSGSWRVSSLSNSLQLSTTESRTELTSCGPNMEHPVGKFIPLLLSIATKHDTISRQRIDLYKRIPCCGNVFQLVVV
jgi:hypothetical protein